MAVEPTKPWWQSKGVWGAVVVIGSLILGWVGQPQAAEAIQEETGSILGIVTQIGAVVGGLLALWGRITAKTPIG